MDNKPDLYSSHKSANSGLGPLNPDQIPKVLMIQTTSEAAGLTLYPLIMDYSTCRSTRPVVVGQPSKFYAV